MDFLDRDPLASEAADTSKASDGIEPPRTSAKPVDAELWTSGSFAAWKERQYGRAPRSAGALVLRSLTYDDIMKTDRSL